MLVLTDTSNQRKKRVFPVLITYFFPLLGVRVRILQFDEHPAETADFFCNCTNVKDEGNVTLKK